MLLFVDQWGVRWEVFMLGLFDRGGIGWLEEKKEICFKFFFLNSGQFMHVRTGCVSCMKILCQTGLKV